MHQDEIEIGTRGRGPVEVTDALARGVAEAAIDAGLCDVYCRHPSGSRGLLELADPRAGAHQHASEAHGIGSTEARSGEVDQPDVACRIDEHVARMRVGMSQADPLGASEHLAEAACEGRSPVSPGAVPQDLVERCGVLDPLEAQRPHVVLERHTEDRRHG